MKMSEKEETINAKVKVLVVILFTIITITVLHILINESISQEKVIALIESKNITNQMSQVITLQHTDVLTGIENKNN
jgi:PleD family two-component response regulator